MASKERFGKFVLLEAIESSGLGTEYRAAKLGSAGLEKIVGVLRLAPAISGHLEVAKGLMDQAKFAAQLQSPNIVKILGIGKVDASYYISSEFMEGKSLRAVFNRCRQDGLPFSVDHTLLIASKICSALEYAHSRKTEGGGRYLHGLLTPAAVIVSYEGEVRVRGFGYWLSRVLETGALAPEERLYLAPEQEAGGAADTRSDTFAVGAILFETLTGQALFQGGRTQDPVARVAQARLQSPTGEDDALPKPIAEILKRALAEPAARFGEIQEMRKAIDTLLFSGDFTPTTFNLAFFMHSLFREDIERESRLLKEEKEASYAELALETASRAHPTAPPAAGPPPKQAPAPPPAAPAPAPAPSAPAPAPAAAPLVPPAAPRAQTPVASEGPTPKRVPAVVPPTPRHPSPPAAAHHTPLPAAHPTHAPPTPHVPLTSAQPPPHPASAPETTSGLTAKDAAAGFTFHKEEPKSRAGLLSGLAVLALVGVAGGYYVTKRAAPPAPPPVTAPPTLSVEARAMERVKELEQKLAALEAEKQAAEEKAAEDTRKKLEAQARAKGQAVDPATLVKAQEDERRRARAEQERKQQEELRRLEEEKKAEEARLTEERRKAEQQQAEEAARAAAAAASTTTLPPPSTAPAEPAVQPGQLMNLSDPGVIAPIAERRPPFSYPSLALRQKVEGTVELNVLVDETGKVTDAQVVTGAGGRMGLNEAAVQYVKQWKFRPATKDGVPVKVWFPVKIDFRLPS